MEQQLQQPAPLELLIQGLDDGETRKRLAKKLGYFCLIYLPHYFPLPPAEFFPDLIAALEDDGIDRLLEIGFRGSAKSTFTSMAYVLYAALVKPKLYPFIVPIADTGTQATAVVSALKYELESNELLREDFGTIELKKVTDKSYEVRKKLESKEEWQARNLLLSTGVRILARSRGQRIRGLRHRQHRPKLVIGDDVENLESVRTQEGRDKTARWWRGEVLGALAHDGRVILVGNWLHTDGLMARMKATSRYKVLEFALLRDGDGTEIERCVWPALYPTQKTIDDKREELGDIAFRREMLLQVVPEEGQDVLPEDIHYYDEPPFDDGNHLAHGVDLAISTKESADYTAIVSGEVTWEGGRTQIYVQPNPVIRHITFSQTMEALDNVRRSTNMSSEFYVEAVAYQQAAIEEMERRAFSVQAMHPIKDKRARLRVAARYIKTGVVKFPRHGCEQLLTQLLGFGAEKHDDAVDALVYLILGVIGDGIEEQKVHYV
jgi:predicted phage terminase large subunit-like protein